MSRSPSTSAASHARPQPVRTCIGCREKEAKSALVRIAVDQVVTTVVVVPDLTGAMGGRGAHLHPTIACLDLAERRKAVSRALRVQGPVDLRAVRAYLTGITPAHQAASSDAATEKKRSTSS